MILGGLDLGKKSILYIAVLKTKPTRHTEIVFYFCVVFYRCSSKEKKGNSTGARRYTSGGKARILAF